MCDLYAKECGFPYFTVIDKGEAHRIYQSWSQLHDDILQSIMVAAEQEGLLLPQPPTGGFWWQLIPFMEKYGYQDGRGWWIKNSIYKSYKDVKSVEVAAPKSLSSSYDKLQNMVGLTEIKSIIDQIISAQKINKLRKDMGLDVAETAKHMITSCELHSFFHFFTIPF